MCKHILFNSFRDSDLETLKLFTERTHENDGYGAIMRYQSGEIKTLKSLNAPAFYIELMRNLSNMQDLVVHHRTSTNGQGIDYAHPFLFQGHYLTHNGVVTVPGKHDTATTNDSEALLHHLIKTDFETKTVQGYFSCFILNHDSTTVLVDKTAPIYTDGRVYSSHKLGDLWQKVEAKKITFQQGKLVSSTDIEVSASLYGMNKAYLSLGNEWSGYDYDVDRDYGSGWKSMQQEYNTDQDDQGQIDLFFDMIDHRELNAMYSMNTVQEVKKYVRELAKILGIPLQKRHVKRIVAEIFSDYAPLEKRVM